MKHVLMFSGGASSYAAGKRLARDRGVTGLSLVFTDTLLALLLALAAPAPRPRPPAPPPVPTPGAYLMRWGGGEYRCTLRADGVYQAAPRHGGAAVWQGSWGYDPKARTLFVQESDDGETWRLYLFAMRGLSGETADGLTLELAKDE